MQSTNWMVHVGAAVAVALASGALYAQTSSDVHGSGGVGATDDRIECTSMCMCIEWIE